MARLKWDETGARFYETGVRNGVFYPINGSGNYTDGVVWNGLTQVSENPSGAEPTPLYADDINYLNLMSVEEFKATIEAYSYPKEFARALGRIELAPGVLIGQQARKKFGFSYRTSIGNDTDGSDHSYNIHLIYGAKASPSSESYSTIDDSPEAITFSWEVATEPIDVANKQPAAHVILSGRLFKENGLMNSMRKLEDILYGTETTEPALPFPSEIADIIREDRYITDSNGNEVLDSLGSPIMSFVIH